MENFNNQESKLAASLSNYQLDIFDLDLAPFERDFIHVFDGHSIKDDLNAIENSEAFSTEQFVLIPVSKSEYGLCILQTHNYYDSEFLTDEIKTFDSRKPAMELAREITNFIEREYCGLIQ